MMRAISLVALSLVCMSHAAHADCAADFAAAMAAHQSAGSYRVTAMRTIGQEARAAEAEYILPDKIHFIKDTLGDEYIFLPEGSWRRSKGSWSTISSKERDDLINPKEISLLGSLKAATNLQCKGPQLIDGKTYRAIAFEMVNTARNNIKILETLYLDNLGRPAIYVSDFEVNGAKVHTIGQVTYDKSISIVPPSAENAVSVAADPACITQMKAVSDTITKSGPLRYDITDQSSGAPINIKVEVVPGAAMRMAFGDNEQVITPSGGWGKLPDGWQPLPAGATREAQAELAESWWSKPEGLANLKCLGQQSLEGQSYAAFAFDLELFLGARTRQHIVLYTAKDNKPVALTAAKDNSSEAPLLAHLTFDPTLKINPPQ